MNEDWTRRTSKAEDEIKDLREAIYGNNETVGMNTRLKVLETRLQIFWWALAGIGSAAITLIVNAIFGKHVGG